jgi:glutathione S-transferase
MILYLKAAEDGFSVGDCPFAHSVCLVLEEKGLDYELKPSTADTKPDWLMEYYEGKMPALRHRKECYVESSVIAEYLDFFFPKPSLKTAKTNTAQAAAEQVLEGFFPAVAKYLKDVEGDDEEIVTALKEKLTSLDQHISDTSNGDFLCGEQFTLLDCRLMPQLYHLQTGIEGFKEGIPSIESDFPSLWAYYQTAAAHPSFQATVYPKEAVLWGWRNVR